MSLLTNKVFNQLFFKKLVELRRARNPFVYQKSGRNFQWTFRPWETQSGGLPKRQSLLEFTFSQNLFSHKQNAQRVRAAVTRDRAAGIGLQHLVEAAAFLDDRFHILHNLRRSARVRDENAISSQIVSALQTLAHILCNAIVDLAAVLFAHAHFAVLHFNARL